MAKRKRTATAQIKEEIVLKKEEFDDTDTKIETTDNENKQITKSTKTRGEKVAVKRMKKEEIEEDEEGQSSMKETILNSVRKLAASSKKLLGAHVSAQGGPENAIRNAISIGCQAFALFIRNQRRWEQKPMEERAVLRWNEAIKATGFPLDRILPHGSYLINPGSPDPVKLDKSRNAMLDECQRCERLGIGLYNFHPGSTTNVGTKEQCLARIAESINFVHERTSFITLVVETMCGSGNTVGDRFEHMRDIIDQVRDKKRVGVCIDTCHSYAAGYDFTKKQTYEEAMEEFENIVGFRYLKALHMNDSGGEFHSKVDRHRNIGEGHLGEAAFRLFMNDPRLDNIPMILETPEGKYTEEMHRLYSLEKKKSK